MPISPDTAVAEADVKPQRPNTLGCIGTVVVCFVMFLMFRFVAVNVLAGAARSGDIGTVYLMTHAGFPADLKDLDSGVTPLMEAVQGGNRNIAELLIKRGADVNAEGAYWDRTPLDYAVADNKKELVTLLLEHGAKVNHVSHFVESGDSPLTAAAHSGQLEIVKILVAHGADVNFHDKNGHDARYRAEFNGHMDVVKFLKHLPR